MTAPIAGRVSKAAVTAGNLVTGGSNAATLLTTVVSIDPIYVTFEGDEQVYLKYTSSRAAASARARATQRTRCRWGSRTRTAIRITGAMVFVDNQVDPRTGTIRARAAFDNKDGYLTPGLFARVKLLGHNTYQRRAGR